LATNLTEEEDRYAREYVPELGKNLNRELNKLSIINK
jgi:hypothetical protein